MFFSCLVLFYKIHSVQCLENCRLKILCDLRNRTQKLRHAVNYYINCHVNCDELRIITGNGKASEIGTNKGL